mgnify:CR=1 FL=1
MKPSPRRKARELAVQAIYSWQVSNNAVTDIETNFLIDNAKRRFDIEFFQLLLRGVCTDITEIDTKLSPNVDRPLDEIDQVEKAILRVATFELITCLEYIACTANSLAFLLRVS